MAPVSVFLAVDDPLQRVLLQRALGRRDDIVIAGVDGDGARALEEVLRLAPDVAVVDAGLPGLAGVELCRRIATARPEVGTRVLLLDGEPPLSRERAVAAGAAGCVPTAGTTAEVGDAIATIANGGTMFHI